MPYRRVGKIIQVKKKGKWVKKAKARSIGAAKRMINLLRMVKHRKT